MTLDYLEAFDYNTGLSWRGVLTRVVVWKICHCFRDQRRMSFARVSKLGVPLLPGKGKGRLDSLPENRCPCFHGYAFSCCILRTFPHTHMQASCPLCKLNKASGGSTGTHVRDVLLHAVLFVFYKWIATVSLPTEFIIAHSSTKTGAKFFGR